MQPLLYSGGCPFSTGDHAALNGLYHPEEYVRAGTENTEERDKRIKSAYHVFFAWQKDGLRKIDGYHGIKSNR